MQQFEILILEEALADIEEVFDYIAYELKSPDTAIDYRFGLLEKINSLKDNAGIFAPSSREFFTRRYGTEVYTANYKKMVIVYNIDGNTAVIRRVMPASLVL
jgi:plasmid stabilization system protein ParE